MKHINHLAEFIPCLLSVRLSFQSIQQAQVHMWARCHTCILLSFDNSAHDNSSTKHIVITDSHQISMSVNTEKKDHSLSSCCAEPFSLSVGPISSPLPVRLFWIENTFHRDLSIVFCLSWCRSIEPNRKVKHNFSQLMDRSERSGRICINLKLSRSFSVFPVTDVGIFASIPYPLLSLSHTNMGANEYTSKQTKKSEILN